MKIINGNEKIEEENLFMIKDDFNKLRKRDVWGMAANQMIFVASTEELLCSTAQKVANKYPEKKFMIYHDGLIKIKIECDDKIIFEGDYYDIEHFYQESYHAFEKYLLERI